MSNRKINWVAPLKIIINPVTLTIGGLYLLVSNAHSDGLEKIKIEADNINFSKTLEDIGQGYYIKNGSTVVFSEEIKKRRNTISYFFNDKMVIVDGADEADRVFKFSELEDTQVVPSIKEIGCNLSNEIPKLLANFSDETGRDHPDAEHLLDVATDFGTWQECVVSSPLDKINLLNITLEGRPK